MSPAVFLLGLGTVAFLGGGAVALNVRGCVGSLERWAAGNAERAMQARGDLGQPQLVMSAQVFRVMATVVALGGLVLSLGGLLALA
ncbi:hypothetical protein ACFYXV_05495 [Streptomyces sp. NPDC002181]|uniref:hypothetical protein n=1 Tax=unclassified Streptomyces TaxID=2593676 RepID=UPI00365E3995